MFIPGKTPGLEPFEDIQVSPVGRRPACLTSPFRTKALFPQPKIKQALDLPWIDPNFLGAVFKGRKGDEKEATKLLEFVQRPRYRETETGESGYGELSSLYSEAVRIIDSLRPTLTLRVQSEGSEEYDEYEEAGDEEEEAEDEGYAERFRYQIHPYAEKFLITDEEAYELVFRLLFFRILNIQTTSSASVITIGPFTTTTTVCFGHDSLIATPQGERLVQDLRRGDEIVGGRVARIIRGSS